MRSCGFPPRYGRFGAIFRRTSSAELGLRFSFLDTSTIGGPNGPYDARDVGSSGAAGRLKRAINPQQNAP